MQVSKVAPCTPRVHPAYHGCTLHNSGAPCTPRVHLAVNSLDALCSPSFTQIHHGEDRKRPHVHGRPARPGGQEQRRRHRLRRYACTTHAHFSGTRHSCKSKTEAPFDTLLDKMLVGPLGDWVSHSAGRGAGGRAGSGRPPLINFTSLSSFWCEADEA